MADCIPEGLRADVEDARLSSACCLSPCDPVDGVLGGMPENRLYGMSLTSSFFVGCLPHLAGAVRGGLNPMPRCTYGADMLGELGLGATTNGASCLGSAAVVVGPGSTPVAEPPLAKPRCTLPFIRLLTGGGTSTSLRRSVKAKRIRVTKPWSAETSLT